MGITTDGLALGVATWAIVAGIPTLLPCLPHHEHHDACHPGRNQPRNQPSKGVGFTNPHFPLAARVGCCRYGGDWSCRRQCAGLAHEAGAGGVDAAVVQGAVGSGGWALVTVHQLCEMACRLAALLARSGSRRRLRRGRPQPAGCPVGVGDDRLGARVTLVVGDGLFNLGEAVAVDFGDAPAEGAPFLGERR